MIESKFDSLVNKILKESLQGGNISSTKVSPAVAPVSNERPVVQPKDIKGQQQQQPMGIKQLPTGIKEPTNPEEPAAIDEPTADQGEPTQDVAAMQKTLLDQLKGDSKQNELYNKQVVALLAAVANNKQNPSSAATTPQASNTPQPSNVPQPSNSQSKQVLNNLLKFS
jgi:hypothetical protein